MCPALIALKCTSSWWVESYGPRLLWWTQINKIEYFLVRATVQIVSVSFWKIPNRCFPFYTKESTKVKLKKKYCIISVLFIELCLVELSIETLYSIINFIFIISLLYWKIRMNWDQIKIKENRWMLDFKDGRKEEIFPQYNIDKINESLQIVLTFF